MLTDYIEVLPNAFNIIRFLESNYFLNKQIKITGFSSDGGYCTFPNPHTTNFGVTDYWNRCKDQGIPECNYNNIMDDCPTLEIIRYPVAHRNTLFNYMNGYFINPNYLHFWGDNFLPYWAYKIHGERLIEYKEPLINIKPHQSFEGEFERDRMVFYYMVKHLKETNDPSYCPNIDMSFLNGTKWQVNP